MFPKEDEMLPMLAYLCSKVAFNFLKVLNPTLNFQTGNLAALPWDSEKLKPYFNSLSDKAKQIIEIYEDDWNSVETSWEFKQPSILKIKEHGNLKLGFQKLNYIHQANVEKVKELEEDINTTFISAFHLQKEVTPNISLNEVSLFCNKSFRANDKIDFSEVLDEKQLKDNIFEFLSFSVGCMFGRYSLDKEGLILSSLGESLESYLLRIPSPSFMPDEDNVIPIIDFDGDWFEDDITERFKAFLKVTFGEEYFTENLLFIEEAIGKDIKKYFIKDFYADHVKRYKKRPIYWMFSSPKCSFNALIYMHRYQPDTASIVLNNYLREFRRKLIARKETNEHIEINPSASQKDITQAIKAIAKIDKVLEEVNDYERDVLYPLASKKQPIDLDDGVKHNYPLFGKALKKVTGLS
jgi:hypothetical protein